MDYPGVAGTPYYSGQVVTLRRPVLPTVSIGRSAGERLSRETWGDRKGLYDVTARKKGKADSRKTGIDPRLVCDIVSRLIYAATPIIVDLISKGGRI